MATIKGNIGSEPKRIDGKDKVFYSFNMAESNGPGREPTWMEVTAFIPETQGDMLTKGAWIEVTGRVEAVPFLRKDGTPGASIKVTTGKVTVLEKS